MTKKDLKIELDKIWPQVKDSMQKINKDLSKIAKSSEKSIVHLSKKVKKDTEKLIMKVKKEELYYELGKLIAPDLTPEQLQNKKVGAIHREINKIEKKLSGRKK